uniref:SJCHGC02520 protein n=1 Tax=Schistosoma japonicum TaxID=6182 RepID=Q5DB02_SCHJA|nr:SJCHGC02520 protein [Schistosoma japonicum]
MLACSRFGLENATDEPRVENKLTLCFNPTRTISSIASKISGLNSDNLFHQKDFDSSAVDLIQLFLNRLDSPVCFVAHNGLRFDFPLLRAQIMSVKGNDYKLNDSNECTNYMYRYSAFISPIKLSTTTNKHSFHLGDIHERVFGEKHIHAHTAEGDCRAMLRLIQYLGSPAIDWLQSHYVNFNSLTPMYSFHTPGISRISSLFPYQRTKVCSNISLSDTTSQLDNLQLE